MTRPIEERLDLDALFAANYRRLTALLYRVTGDTLQAEEVAAEAFCRLYQKPPRSDHNLEGWLYRTGIRLALDHRKKAQRRARYEAAFGALLGRSTTPEQVLERQEESARVRATLTALRVQQVSLLLLRAEGLTYAELASTLHLNPASVGTLLTRAEVAFRTEHERRYGHR